MQLPASKVSRRLRLAGNILRALFICILIVVIARVSSPQSETFWSVYETPGDLVRLVLGVVVCLWILWHLFIPPKDAAAYRIWVYLGLAAVPLGLICAFAVW
jgi:hypothetical protein